MKRPAKTSCCYTVLILNALMCACAASADTAALARIRYKVVDQDGRPVTNVTVHLAWHDSAFQPPANIYTLTDSNGCFVAERSCGYFLYAGISKLGYYNTSDRVSFANTTASPKIADGKWQPYDALKVVHLKRIGNVGKLKVFPWTANNKKIPQLDKWLPFDLEYCDWCSPYGSGEHEDMVLRFHSIVKHPVREYDVSMEVAFTNSPYAGVYRLEKETWSAFETQGNANPDSSFVDLLHFVKSRVPGTNAVQAILNEDSYLVFRTRVKTDAKGNFVSAHYGVIQGPWNFDGQVMSIPDGCFNPIPNDLNIEDGRALRENLRCQTRQDQE